MTPWTAYAALARQHPELMTECECRRAFYYQCGCLGGYCERCDDSGQRPKDLGELIAMLEETDPTRRHRLSLERFELGYRASWQCLDDDGWRTIAHAAWHSAEKAVASIWLLVTGKEAAR